MLPLKTNTDLPNNKEDSLSNNQWIISNNWISSDNNNNKWGWWNNDILKRWNIKINDIYGKYVQIYLDY